MQLLNSKTDSKIGSNRRGVNWYQQSRRCPKVGISRQMANYFSLLKIHHILCTFIRINGDQICLKYTER